MEMSDIGQRHGGDHTRLDENDGSPSYDVHSSRLSGVSTDAGQSAPLANITYPSGVMLPEAVPLSTSTMNSAYATYGTGTQGLEQLSFQSSYSAPVAQSHYAPQQFNAGAPVPTTFKATSSPVLLDGNTLDPIPAGLPLPPRSSTPYLVETGTTSTVPSKEMQVGSLLPPGFQDLTWSTTSTTQARGTTVHQPSTLANKPGMGRDLAMATESDVEERLAKVQNVMEEKFGMQRKKFMNHMMQMEGKGCPFTRYSKDGTQCKLNVRGNLSIVVTV